jgi:hypothetical protein
MKDNELIKVFVNGEEALWPKAEYLDYKAIQLGFEDYEDLKNHGFHLED